jgi:hypothetical protein
MMMSLAISKMSNGPQEVAGPAPDKQGELSDQLATPRMV